MKIRTILAALAIATFSPTVMFAQTAGDAGSVNSGTGTQTGSGINRAEGTAKDIPNTGNGTGVTTGTGTQTGSGTDRGATETTGTPTPTPMP